MVFTKEESKELIDKILSYSKADSASVSLSGSNSNNLRFALNTVSTCGAINSISSDITSNFGKKSGSVRITSIDNESIERGIRMSEEIAKLTPDNEEFMPPLEKKSGYLEVDEFFDATDQLTPKDISEKVSYTLKKSLDNDLTAAGYFENKSGFYAVGNTNNLFAYHKDTLAVFSSTIRTKDGKGSNKIDRSYADINLLDVKKFSDRVIDKTILSRDPIRYEPGKYVTILDNTAVADMVGNLIGYMNKEALMKEEVFFLIRKS